MPDDLVNLRVSIGFSNSRHIENMEEVLIKSPLNTIAIVLAWKSQVLSVKDTTEPRKAVIK